MPDYMTLMGAEDVSRAGYSMKSAAEEMSRAAANIDDALRRHQMFMEDWLQRYESAQHPVLPTSTPI